MLSILRVIYYTAVSCPSKQLLPLSFEIAHSVSNKESKLSGWLRLNSVALQNKRQEFKLPSVNSAAFADHLNNTKVVAGRVTQPFDELSRKSGALGHTNLTVDRDGVIRKIPMTIDYQGRDFLSLALQVARKYMRVGLEDVKSDSNGLCLSHNEIPTDPAYRMLIDFSGRDNNIRKFSFSDIWESMSHGICIPISNDLMIVRRSSKASCVCVL